MNNKFPIKYLIGSVVFLILVSTVFVYLYLQIDKNNQAAEKAEMDWNNEISKLNNAKTLNKFVQTINTEKSLLETHFIKSKDVVSFLDYIEKLSVKAGASIEIVSVDEGDGTSGLSLNFKSSGSFENLYKFLLLLENSEYQIVIPSLNLDKQFGVEGVWNAFFSIRLYTFIKE